MTPALLNPTPSPSLLYHMLTGGAHGSTVQPKPRAPLPPFDPATFEAPDEHTAPSWHPVYTELDTPPLARPNVRWWRGDAWGVTVPDLPYVDGGATGAAQSRVLTYFLDRYGRKFEDKILRAHGEAGYTHFSISPQDSFAVGMTVDEYVAMSVRVRQAGFAVHHLLRSKYYTSASAAPLSATTSASRHRFPFAGDHLQPKRPVARNLDERVHTIQVSTMSIDYDEPNALIDKLLNAGAMQVATPAWEMNYWSPEICRAMIDHDAAIIGTACLIMLHFYPHYISWQIDGESPTSFWEANYGKTDGVLYQADPFWSAGMMAARTTDALDRLAPGGLWGLGLSGRPDPATGAEHPFDVVGWETIATAQFNNMLDGNNRLADEEIGNLKGFELSCAPGRQAVMGYGNGGRMPDGMAL